jgi:hypothetical protein
MCDDGPIPLLGVTTGMSLDLFAGFIGRNIVPLAILGAAGATAGAIATVADNVVVFVTTFADTVWTDFLVPGVWSIAVGAPVALLASLALTLRHRTKARPATPVPPVLEPVVDAEPAPATPAEDEDRCWQCPVRAVPRGMLDAGQIEATGTYVTDPDFELEGASR